ncbi:MAG: hypothetical protein K0S71_449 [Clostridia bacterium]|jgi:hypothetical protein|nr:hypothetical protein [Clostridia bacterium]
MLRPIDTQTIYQQTQELSNRQQVHNQGEHTKQGQFAHIMQKQTEIKNESVNELNKDEKVDNHLNKDKEKDQNRQKKNKKKKSTKNNESKKWDNETKIDIRI